MSFRRGPGYWPAPVTQEVIAVEVSPVQSAEAPYRVLSKIREDLRPYAIVVHAFYGQTLDEAERYYRAHLKSDQFLKACSTAGKFGATRCREERVAERWDGRSWRRA